MLHTTLYPHLADVEQQVQATFLSLVNQLSVTEGVTETLEEEDRTFWVQKNIRNRATEIVNAERIYA